MSGRNEAKSYGPHVDYPQHTETYFIFAQWTKLSGRFPIRSNYTKNTVIMLADEGGELVTVPDSGSATGNMAEKVISVEFT